MQLLTEDIKGNLPKLYSTDGENDPMAWCKFFDPCGSWTWYVTEGEEQADGDWMFFGLVEGMEKEWGYFSLNELQSVHGPLGLGIERDLYYEPTILSRSA